MILTAQSTPQHNALKQPLCVFHGHQIPNFRYRQVAVLHIGDLELQLAGDSGLISAPSPGDDQPGDVPAIAALMFGQIELHIILPAVQTPAGW